MQLYKMGQVAVKRRHAQEDIVKKRREEQEEAELEKLRAPHRHISMFNVGEKEERKVAPKIVHALRADPMSEEGLALLPNLPDSLPYAKVKNMVSRLVPPGPAISKRFENAYQKKPTASSSSRGGSATSRRSATPPAWRPGGASSLVASTPPPPKENSSSSNNNNSRRPSPTVRNSSAAGGGRRSPSPVLDRLYVNRNAPKEAAQMQQKMYDAREVEDIIEGRKRDNPHFAKMVAKNPEMEDQYRRRLLRTRQEERRLQEVRQTHAARTDLRFVVA